MKALFRADAAQMIGTGHVMRCLTLADRLAARGATCTFVCRRHPGNLLDMIRRREHGAVGLPMAPSADGDAWLGAEVLADAAETLAVAAELRPDWLVVDHYSIDARWEAVVAPACRRTLVIDDLADRRHRGTLLLDQTLGRTAQDYAGLTGADTVVLAGAGYSLLRPEFAHWRERSLARRAVPALRHILVTMGGVDPSNVSGDVLRAIAAVPGAEALTVTVVLGPTAPWTAEVRTQAAAMPCPTRVLCGVDNMAELMAQADLCVGAAGGTSWERCCLGLPTVMMVLADNQKDVARALEQAGAAIAVAADADRGARVRDILASLDPAALDRLSRAAAAVTDGQGAERLAAQMWELS